MRSNLHNVQVIALFVLLMAACWPQRKTAIRIEDENAACKQIVFSTSIRIPPGDENNIYSVCPDGSQLHPLTDVSTHDFNPFWSPDGSTIAFISNRSGTMHLYLMDPDGGNIRQITFGPDGVGWSLFWMPDGNRIAMYKYPDHDARSWYAVDVRTKEIIPLTNWSDDIYFLRTVFSHDGSRLVYRTWKKQAIGGIMKYYFHVQNIDGSNAYVLISDIKTRYKPVWSPDDSKMALLLDLHKGLDDFENHFAIYTVNLDGSNLQAVTEPIYPQAVAFDWSPDGESLLIYDKLTLYILDLKSGRTYKLLTVEYPDFIGGFSWQP